MLAHVRKHFNLPQMSGIDLIKKIREKDQNYTKKNNTY